MTADPKDTLNALDRQRIVFEDIIELLRSVPCSGITCPECPLQYAKGCKLSAIRDMSYDIVARAKERYEIVAQRERENMMEIIHSQLSDVMSPVADITSSEITFREGKVYVELHGVEKR